MNNNIIRFEIKHSYKSLFIWLSVLIIFAFIFESIYPSFTKDLSQMTSLLANYPPALLKSFGLDLNLWNTYEGYFTYCITFLNLISFAFSAIIALKMFNKEYRHKSIEFLFTKPVKRSTIFHSKMAALLILNIMFFLSSLIANILISSVFATVNYTKFIELNMSTFFLQIIATAFAVLVSIIFPKLKGISSIGFAIAFGFYFLYILSNFATSDILAYISLFGLFKSVDIVSNGYSLSSIIIFIGITIIVYLGGLILYKRKDVL